MYTIRHGAERNKCRLVPVGLQLPILLGQFDNLEHRSTGGVWNSRKLVLPFLMHKIEQEGATVAYLNISVMAFGPVGRQQSRPRKQVLLLSGPVRCIG